MTSVVKSTWHCMRWRGRECVSDCHVQAAAQRELSEGEQPRRCSRTKATPKAADRQRAGPVWPQHAPAADRAWRADNLRACGVKVNLWLAACWLGSRQRTPAVDRARRTDNPVNAQWAAWPRVHSNCGPSLPFYTSLWDWRYFWGRKKTKDGTLTSRSPFNCALYKIAG